MPDDRLLDLELADVVELVERRRPRDALDGITVAEAVVAELGRLGDRLIGYYIERARNDGHSWADIGAHAGVTRQAAQQRFGARWSALTIDDLERAGAFERVTARAHEALRRAEAHARRLRHDAVGVEHLLIAILEDRATLAWKALHAAGTDPSAVRRRLLAEWPAGEGRPPAAVPVSATARRCISAALDEALALGHNYIGTEHLLLGAIDRDPDVTAVLAEHGVDLDTTRDAIEALLDAFLSQRE